MFLELLVVKDVVVILCGGLTQCLGRGRGEHLLDVRQRGLGAVAEVSGEDSVVIETIFQWPGIGNAFKTAVTGQNYPLVMMIALFSVLAVLMASFLVDILTAVLDPRVKLE